MMISVKLDRSCFSQREGEEHEDREGGGESGGLGKIAVGKISLGDLIADHLRVFASHKIGNHVGSEHWDKDNNRCSGNSATDSWKKNVIDRPETSGTQIACSFQKGKIEFFGHGIDGQDGKREKRINTHENHRHGMIEQCRIRVHPMPLFEYAREKPFRMQNLFPCEHADEKIGPKWDDDKQEQP